MSHVFGSLRQNGFVVRDIRKAMAQWMDVAGVGPFFYIQDQPLREFRYRGALSPVRMSVALAHTGGVQIELIQQNNDAPSAFRDFLDAGREGLQHVAFWTTEFDSHHQRAIARGLEVLQEGCSGSGGPDERFAYFTSEAHPDAVIELSEVSGRKGQLFRMVENAARNWDGSDPVRDMAPLVLPS